MLIHFLSLFLEFSCYIFLLQANSSERSTDPKTTKEVPFISDWGKAPFYGSSDVFWEQVKNYDRTTFPPPEKAGLFLYATACASLDSFPCSARIPRMCIEKQEYPYSPIHFISDLSNRLQGWQHWTDEVLANSDYVDILKRADILRCIQLCRDLRIRQDQDALTVLISRWCSSTCTFVTAWGEFTPTLEDVYVIYQ